MREWLRRWGISEQALKTVIAVGLSWEIGRRIPGAAEFPYFAPLAALLSMQFTIAETVSAAANRTLGVIAGVTVALAVGQFLGISVWSLCLVVLVSLLTGPWLRMKGPATTQVAVSAMLVLFIGSGTAVGYSFLRIVETFIGAVVGVVVNAVLVPPTYVDGARSALDRLADQVTDALRELSEGLAGGMNEEEARDRLARARGLRDPLAEAREAVQYAGASLEYHPRRRRIRDELAVLEKRMALLERSVAQTRSIARAVADALGAPRAIPGPLLSGELTRAMASLLDALARVLDSIDRQEGADKHREGEAALAEAYRARDTLFDLAHGAVPELPAADWYALGAVISLAERMLADLTRVVHGRQDEADGLVLYDRV